MYLLINIVGILIAIFLSIIAYFLWSFQYWKKKKIPYIEGAIPYGSISSPFKRKVGLGEDIHNLYKTAKAKGWNKHCGLYTMARPSYMVLDLELAKLILTKDFDHFTDRGLYYNEKDDPLSGHLFALGGTKWRNLRTKLTPTFTSGKMKNMFPTLVKCGEELEKFLDKEIKNHESSDIKSALSKFSTDIIGSCAFGIDCNSFEDSNSLFLKYGRRIFERTKLENFTTIFSITFPELTRAFGIRVFSKDVSDFFFKLVKDTLAYRKKNNIVRPDFLQLLMEIMHTEDDPKHSGDGMALTVEEAVAQCFVFFLAGFETSSTTMTFALFELARNPDIQEKVREEVFDVLKKHDNKITYDSLSEMKYMRQVIDETLRKYPPVPFITRESVQDWKIPDTDIVLDKGTRINIPVIGYHYDPEYYDNPDIFNPDRFNDENKQNIHPYAHIPFGEGPRICIGMRFGVMQSKIGLTTVLKNYKVTVSKKTKVPLVFSRNSFVPTTDGGLWLDLEKL